MIPQTALFSKYRKQQEVFIMAKAKQLPSGTWRVLVYDGKDASGKRIYTSFTAPTEKEANFMALDHQLHHQNRQKATEITFEKALQQYIENRNAILSPSTIREYKRMQKYFSEKLLKTPLKKVSQYMVQKEINLFSKTHAPKSVKNIHGLISAVLKEYNPNMILCTKLPQKQKISCYIPSENDIILLLNGAKQYYPQLFIPILLACFIGLRRSEICALKWNDIDFKNKTITIKSAKVLNEYTDWIIKNPKSFSGNRTLIISDTILKILQNFKKENKSKKEDFVISITPSMITNNFSRLLKKIELPHFRFHDLRHFNASIMLSLNIPDKYAMERMGHATNTILKTVYQHTFTDKQIEVSHTINHYIDTIMQHEMQHKKNTP